MLAVMLGGSFLPQPAVLGVAIALDCIHTAMMAARFGVNAGDRFQVAKGLHHLYLIVPAWCFVGPSLAA
jgi:hypothetical protein